MADKMYWAASCKSCSGMVVSRHVQYTLDVRGRMMEETLPEGTVKRRCDHCGTVSDFDLRQLRPTAVKFLIPKVQ
jgi:uncharacterized Zn finger protein